MAEQPQSLQTLMPELWEKYDGDDDPDIFQDIAVARDGGFSEVGNLWSKSRWVSALVAVALLASNTYVILAADVGQISASLSGTGVQREFLMTKVLSVKLMQWFETWENGSQKLVEIVPRGVEIMCAIELFGLAVLWFYLLRSILRSLCTSHAMIRWTSFSHAFWLIIPELSSYSAMRLLHFVTPSILISDFSTLSSRQLGSKLQTTCIWSQFILTRVFCLIVGIDAFLMKFRENEDIIHGRDLSLSKAWKLLIFISQILGIVQLGLFVRDRLFLFIFGGEDSLMQPREMARKEVWCALLAREMYEQMTVGQWIALVLTFSDEDFQRLVLNERGKARAGALLTSARDFTTGPGSDDKGMLDLSTDSIFGNELREIQPTEPAVDSDSSSDDDGCWAKA